MADYQYGTYYNYNYGDLFDAAYGGNYNYNYNIYTYYSTTNTQSVTYSVYYKAPTYSKVYTAPTYSTVKVPVKPTAPAKKTTTSITVKASTSSSTAPKEVKKADPDGTLCTTSVDCKNYCC